jgi:hypothetical protein
MGTRGTRGADVYAGSALPLTPASSRGSLPKRESRRQSGLGFDPDFSHFRLSSCGGSRKACASAANRQRNASYRCSDGYRRRWKPPSPFSERWFIGSRQAQKLVKRVAGHSGVGSKAWIAPFCGDMQKPP